MVQTDCHHAASSVPPYISSHTFPLYLQSQDLKTLETYLPVEIVQVYRGMGMKHGLYDWQVRRCYVHACIEPFLVLGRNMHLYFRPPGVALLMHTMPLQVECLTMGGVLGGSNLVFAAPTSAGKSVVYEILALRRMLTTGKPFMLVLPTVVLCQQKVPTGHCLC
jgi:hypothetical protein